MYILHNSVYGYLYVISESLLLKVSKCTWKNIAEADLKHDMAVTSILLLAFLICHLILVNTSWFYFRCILHSFDCRLPHCILHSRPLQILSIRNIEDVDYLPPPLSFLFGARLIMFAMHVSIS